jgi:hypothetical protein
MHKKASTFSPQFYHKALPKYYRVNEIQNFRPKKYKIMHDNPSKHINGER